MIELKEISAAQPADYAFMERLLTQAFPNDEYRDLDELRRYSTERPEFHIALIMDGPERIGFVNYWDLEGFTYLEHLAIDPALRNRRYGAQVLDLLVARLKNPLILEVEMPEDEMSQRRIGFYERNGFRLLDGEYMQPAYKPCSHPLPMRIMMRGESGDLSFDEIVSTLHHHIYNA